MVMSLWPRFLAHPVESRNLSVMGSESEGKCITKVQVSA